MLLEAINYMKMLQATNEPLDSRYLLFTLDDVNSVLTISRSSEDFSREATDVVAVTFVNVQESIERSDDKYKVRCNYNDVIKKTMLDSSESYSRSDFDNLGIAFFMSDDGIDDVEILST